MKTSFYTIEKVVLVQRESKAYLPWIYYVVLRGPRGGKIFCDLFNIERLINSQYGGVAPDRPYTILTNWAHNNKKLVYMTLSNEQLENLGIDDYSLIFEEDKSINKKLVRRNNNELYEKVKKSFKMD